MLLGKLLFLLIHIYIYTYFIHTSNNIENYRGENTSIVSSTCKNKDCVPQGESKLERKKMGRRLDMILRKKKLEFGGGEAGKETEDNDTKLYTKLLKERDLKLPKTLKDMMTMIKKENGNLDGVRVVGLLQYGS